MRKRFCDNQTLSRAVLGVGALALSNVQVALRRLSSRSLGIAFLIFVAATGLAGGRAIVASLRVLTDLCDLANTAKGA